jgi:cobalamin biosynthesis Mg chelatase CobN
MRLRASLRLRAQLTIMVVLSTLLLLLVLVTEVKANSQHQTVPTMPPPTKSPTVTPPGIPVISPENSPTHSLQPSATLMQATLLPPAQTATAAATHTELAIQNSPTATFEQATASPALITGTMSSQENATMTASSLIPTQVPASQGQQSPTVYLMIGAGLGLIFLIALVIWIWRRKSRTE